MTTILVDPKSPGVKNAMDLKKGMQTHLTEKAFTINQRTPITNIETDESFKQYSKLVGRFYGRVEASELDRSQIKVEYPKLNGQTSVLVRRVKDVPRPVRLAEWSMVSEWTLDKPALEAMNPTQSYERAVASLAER